MDWLHQAQTARQNHTRRSQTKKLLVLSGFLDQKFEGNLKEVGQIVPDSARISLCLQKKTESGVVWLNLRPSHVVFPKIGISRLFWDFTQKLGFQAKYMDFSRPRASEIPIKAP